MSPHYTIVVCQETDGYYAEITPHLGGFPRGPHRDEEAVIEATAEFFRANRLLLPTDISRHLRFELPPLPPPPSQGE